MRHYDCLYLLSLYQTQGVISFCRPSFDIGLLTIKAYNFWWHNYKLQELFIDMELHRDLLFIWGVKKPVVLLIFFYYFSLFITVFHCWVFFVYWLALQLIILHLLLFFLFVFIYLFWADSRDIIGISWDTLGYLVKSNNEWIRTLN